MTATAVVSGLPFESVNVPLKLTKGGTTALVLVDNVCCATLSKLHSKS